MSYIQPSTDTKPATRLEHRCIDNLCVSSNVAAPSNRDARTRAKVIHLICMSIFNTHRAIFVPFALILGRVYLGLEHELLLEPGLNCLKAGERLALRRYHDARSRTLQNPSPMSLRAAWRMERWRSTRLWRQISCAPENSGMRWNLKHCIHRRRRRRARCVAYVTVRHE